MTITYLPRLPVQSTQTTSYPGVVDTPMLRNFSSRQLDPEGFWANLENIQLLKRVARPEELANAALFLASDNASYITGTDMLVDGGLVLG